MHAEVLEFVQDLANRDRKRFRASFVAQHTSVAIDQVRRDLMDLAKIGDLVANFEVVSPESGETLRSFREREEIPTTLEDADGELFEVNEQLIWVSFSPTAKLRDDAAGSAKAQAGQPRSGKAEARHRAPWSLTTRSSNTWSTGPQSWQASARAFR